MQEEPANLRLEFSVLRIKLLHGQSAVASLQAMTYLGLAHATADQIRSARELVTTQQPTDEQVATLRLQKLMHSLTSDAARSAVDAAAIIYAHSILDSLMLSLCRFTTLFSANEWIPLIRERKVAFGQIEPTGGNEKLRRKLLDDYLVQLQRESLAFKCDTIFKVLRPRTTRGVLSKFKYSRPRLMLIDQFRHDLVHQLKFHRKSRLPKAKVEYLFAVGDFFLALTAKHYGIETMLEIASPQ